MGMTKLSFPAAVTAICRGAANEIMLRKLTDAERFAVRGAALSALDELYYDGITEAARNRLERVKLPKGRKAALGWHGRTALLHLAGWADVP